MVTSLWIGLAAGISTFTAVVPQRAFTPVDIRQVEVGGEIGRRIDVTVNNNLLVMDLDKDFLQPFREREAESGYVGLGKTVDALARLAAYTGDNRLIEKKNKVVGEIIALQEPDGYLGFFKESSRLNSLWDIHEMSYLIYGLITDYELFGNEKALAAAVKGANYLIDGWRATRTR